MEQKPRSTSSNLCLALVVIGLLALPLHAWATPSSEFIFSEFNLGGGLWKYEYTAVNTSDPVADAGFDVYDLILTFTPPLTLTDLVSPSGWSEISDDATFIDWFSTNPDAPPIGTDIPPSASLSGFGFTSNTRLGSLPFEALLTNPADPNNPSLVTGNTITTVIPEPSTLFLLAFGLFGLGYLRKKRTSVASVLPGGSV